MVVFTLLHLLGFSSVAFALCIFFCCCKSCCNLPFIKRTFSSVFALLIVAGTFQGITFLQEQWYPQNFETLNQIVKVEFNASALF